MVVNGIEIKEGQVWEDRICRTVRIAPYDGGVYCWKAVLPDGSWNSVNSNGLYRTDCPYNPADLVELISQPEDQNKGEDSMQESKIVNFKVGDKVRILRKDTTFGWDEDMEDFIGKEVTIDYAREGYTEGAGGLKFGYSIAGWMWSEEALELIPDPTEQPQPKEQTYTEEQIRRAFVTCGYLSGGVEDEIMQELKKSTDPEYAMYLKLKEKFGE